MKSKTYKKKSHFNSIKFLIDFVEKLISMQYVNGLEIAQATLNELNYLANSQNIKWDLIMQTKDIILYSAEDENGTLQFKNIGEIDCTAEDVWNVLYRTELQEKWDDFCIKSKLLEELDGLNFIDFQAMASPLGGTPRYFCLFKSCSIDLKNRVYQLTFRSIDHESADQEISTIDGNAFFTEIGTCGWILEEIGEKRCRVTYITQIAESALLPLVPQDSFAHCKQLYKQSGMHTIYKLVSLKRYMDAMNDQQLSTLHQYRFGFSQESLEIFKAVSDTIGHVELNRWHMFRKQREIEFYCKDSEPEVREKLTIKPDDSATDIITSGFIACSNSTPDIVQSFILSNNTHLIDPWTFHCKTIEQINENTSIIEMRFRSIFNPENTQSHQMVKQVINLPLNITFIGFKSLDVPHNSRGLWYSPSGFFIFPLEKGCSIRYLSHFTMIIPSSLKYIPKHKLLLSVSEKFTGSMQLMKHQIIKHSINPSLQNLQVDEDIKRIWRTFTDKSFDEIIDLLYNTAISEIDKDVDSIKNTNTFLDFWKDANDKQVENNKSKRKYKDIIEKSSIMSVNSKFFFSQPETQQATLPAPFTGDWDRYFKRKPFLLLVSNKRTFLPHPKVAKSNNCQNSNSNSFFDILPDEIVEYIFSYLDAVDLTKLSMTCSTFHKASQNEFLWKSLFESKFSNVYQQQQQQQNNNDNELSTPTITRPSSPTLTPTQTESLNQSELRDKWRDMYITQEYTYNNWQKGKSKISLLRGHKAKITCLQFGQDIAITGSRDKDLRIWSLGTKICDTVVRPTNCSVVSFENDNLSRTKLSNLNDTGILRIGYSNGLIYYYDLAHKSIINQKRYVFLADGFIFDKEKVYVWESNSVQLWDNNSNQRTHLLNHGRTKINQSRLGPQSNTIYSCCSDKTLKLWDLSYAQDTPSMVFQKHTASVNCVDFLDDHLFFTGSSDKTIRLWDSRNPTSTIQTIKAHQSHLRSIKVVNLKRLISADDNAIHIWEIDKDNLPKATSILDSYQKGISAMTSDEESVFAGFSDGVVKFYDFT